MKDEAQEEDEGDMRRPPPGPPPRQGRRGRRSGTPARPCLLAPGFGREAMPRPCERGAG